MKLLDILLEGTVEYRVKFVIIKDKDVSQGSASYKDLNDAKKFFDSLTNDPEVYRAQIDKVLGADSSRDMGAMTYAGGTEEIERYSHPATKGVDQGGKKFDELTPAEQDIRMFANSRMGTMGKKGFTSKDGSYKYLEENKIGKLLGARNYKYVGDPMNGKAILPGPMDINEKNQLIKKARQAGYVAKPNMGGGVTIFIKEAKDAFSGYFSKANLGRQIMDAEEILDSGIQNGEPLDSETEMLVQQELERLKKLYVDNHGYTGMMATADPDLKKEKVIKFLKKKGY